MSCSAKVSSSLRRVATAVAFGTCYHIPFFGDIGALSRVSSVDNVEIDEAVCGRNNFHVGTVHDLVVFLASIILASVKSSMFYHALIKVVSAKHTGAIDSGVSQLLRKSILPLTVPLD